MLMWRGCVGVKRVRYLCKCPPCQGRISIGFFQFCRIDQTLSRRLFPRTNQQWHTWDIIHGTKCLTTRVCRDRRLLLKGHRIQQKCFFQMHFGFFKIDRHGWWIVGRGGRGGGGGGGGIGSGGVGVVGGVAFTLMINEIDPS